MTQLQSCREGAREDCRRRGIEHCQRYSCFVFLKETVRPPIRLAREKSEIHIVEILQLVLFRDWLRALSKLLENR